VKLDGSSSGPSQGPPPGVETIIKLYKSLQLYDQAAKRAIYGSRFFAIDEGYVGLAPEGCPQG
jgi:hypothetical protein